MSVVEKQGDFKTSLLNRVKHLFGATENFCPISFAQCNIFFQPITGPEYIYPHWTISALTLYRKYIRVGAIYHRMTFKFNTGIHVEW